MITRTLALAGLLVATASCSSTHPPYKGPPPDYEPPRAFPGASAAAPPAPEAVAPAYGTPEELGANVDAYMASFGAKWGEAYAASGVLAVSQDGKPVLVRSYGKADRAKGTAFTLDTRLRIGSLTKQFTAAAVLKLAEAGQLSTKDSIRKLVKDLPESYQAVTLHHLLSQTSGVPNYTDDPTWLARKAQDIPRADMVAWFAQHPPDYTPGSRFTYSNSNYYLLTLAVEQASKKPLAAFLAEQVVAPAGMMATSLDPLADAALGYTRDPLGALVRADEVNDSISLGAGFLRSSAKDMLLWDRALLGNAVLSDLSKVELFTPGAKCPECGGSDYAYGWIVDTVGGVETEWHNGKIDGFNSFFARAPSKGVAVVLLSNNFNFETTVAGRAVLTMALTGQPKAGPVERDVVPLEEALGKGMAGEYVIAKAQRKILEEKLPAPVLASIEGMEVKWEGGALSMKPSGQTWFGLRKAADGPLFNSDFSIDIVPDLGDAKKPPKTVKGFTLKQAAFSVEYTRGKLPPKPKAKEPKPQHKPKEPPLKK